MVRALGAASASPARAHQASAPYEPPKTDSGRLVSSIAPEFPDKLEGLARVHAPYGEYLEFGTVNMLQRPYVRPTADEVEPDFNAEASRVIKGVATRFGQ